MSLARERVAIYTGSFDPITLGHVNVIERASRLTDRLIVGIGHNAIKKLMFEPEERIELVRQAVAHLDNVDVQIFTGLAVDFVRKCNAKVMIRGIRPLTDIAAEFTMMLANRELNDEVETVFLMADQSLAHVSSSLIKEIAPLADDDKMARFVPLHVIKALRQKMGR
ncbi:MAG: pantetheine-phosphate adenylyltransferase [Planctomycetales bacterium]|nr:pantetheine-phosphate adenylyltransferase [Planctomycetales bacterium]